MKKLLWYTIAIVFTGTLALFNTSSAGLFGPDEKTETQEPVAPMEEPSTPPGAAEEVAPAGEEVTLSGMINEGNTFIADNGESYVLSENERSKELEALAGKKIEIKGTVMEAAGEKTVEVTEYNILE